MEMQIRVKPRVMMVGNCSKYRIMTTKQIFVGSGPESSRGKQLECIYIKDKALLINGGKV